MRKYRQQTDRPPPAATNPGPQEAICGPARAIRDRSHPQESCRRPLDFHPSSIAVVLSPRFAVSPSSRSSTADAHAVVVRGSPVAATRALAFVEDDQALQGRLLREAVPGCVLRRGSLERSGPEVSARRGRVACGSLRCAIAAGRMPPAKPHDFNGRWPPRHQSPIRDGCSSYGEKFAIEFVSGWAFRTGRGVPVILTSGKVADSSACPP
jgi:hypothetical protein